MAIVIKVKADTKEFEKDVKDAANRAKKSVESVTAGGTGGGGLGKISDEFKRMRTEGEALRTRLDALRQGNVNLQGSLGGTLTRLTALTGGVTALATAAAAAATGIVAMGKSGSVAAQGLLELSRKQEITIEQTQQLVIRTKDYSERLSTLGGILSNQVVKGAADAFNEFEVLDRQFTAVQITIADHLKPGLDELGIALQHAALAATPLGIALADDLAAGMRTAARDISATAREFSFLQSIFDTFSVNNIVRELQRLREEQFGATPQRFTDIPVPRPPATSNLNILGLTGAQTYQQFGRAPAARAARAPRAAREPNIPSESVDALRILNQVLSQLEENAKGAAVGIAAMNARTLQVLEGRARLRAQQEDIPTFTAEQAGLTSGVDESGIRGKLIQADLEKQFQIFDEVRQQAIRFKEGIVFTFESAFREGFEKGPKAFLQATASAIKSFFSQIAAELSTGIIEMILFGKGGITGRGVGTSGTLGGLGAALGGFGRTGGGGGGGGFLGGLLGNFGGLGGGTFGGSIFGGGAGGGGIGVASSLSSSIGGFSGFSGGFGGISNAVAQQVGFGGAGAASGGLFGGLLGAVAGPAAIGGLLGTGLGGKSLGGKILGGIGGGIAGIGVGLGAAVGLAGGGLLAGALAATGFGLLALPFIVGAVLLGKAKQRKVDEQAADAIWVAEREQIRTLISAVNADRIEGYDALAQWSQLRSQTVSQLNQIKTTSVRESRLTNQLRDLDNGVVAELRAAVERQARRRGVSGMLVPEFEAGGRVPGVDRGYDSVMIKARPGEVVLNRQQQASIQARAGDRIFEEVGIQSFQYGGRVSAAPQVPQSLHLTISLEGDASAVIGNLIVRGVETSSGQRAIVSVVKNGRKNGEL